MMPSMDLRDDAVGIGSPDEGFGFAVVLAEVSVDRGLEIDQRVEGAALQPPPGERGEEALDRIGPGAGGGHEMKRPARVPGEPGTHLGVLVGGIIVEDGVDQLAGRHGGLNPIEKADELLVAVPCHALADHGAVEDIERGEQRGRAVPEYSCWNATMPVATKAGAIRSA